MFSLVLGLLYWFAGYANSIAFSAAFQADGFTPSEGFHGLALAPAIGQWAKAVFFSPFALLVNIVLWALCMSVARELHTRCYWFLNGTLHFALHWCSAAALYWLAAISAHVSAARLGLEFGEPVLRGLLHGGRSQQSSAPV